jgi:methylated-DNA-protein-cysteine methyltransferase-like protein
MPERELYKRIYALVAQVPPGKVATYGDIAEIVGNCDARAVGYALNALPSDRAAEVPWQRAMLEAEGIAFDERGRIPLSRFRWRGPGIDDSPDADDDSGQLPLF